MMQIHDSPKPRKRNQIKERLFDWKTTIPGILLIVAAVLISRIEIDETFKDFLVYPIALSGLAALGIKSKK